MRTKRKFLTSKIRLSIAEKFGFKCYHCDKQFDRNKLVNPQTGYLWLKEFGKLEYHIDHLKSLYDGGRDEIDNMVFSCQKCNLSKGKKTVYGKKSYA